jgi:hypothetical protein
MDRRRLACALAVTAVLAVPAAAANAADPSTKTLADTSVDEPASASVNVCGGKGTGDIGVRVDAPYRADDVAPWIRISIEYYSDQDGAWHPAAGGDSGWFQGGPVGTGVETGYTFPYEAPAADGRLVMRGIAQIEWRPDAGRRQLVTTTCEIAGQPAPPAG